VRQPIRLVLPLLLLALLTACGKKPDAPAGAPAAGGGMPPPEVEVIVATPGAVARTVEVPGRLRAVRSAEVRARVEGILDKRLYQEGSEVKAGEVLFRIDPRTLAANEEAAKAALTQAQAQALVAGQNLERKKALIASNAVSRQDYDQAVATQAQAEAAVDSAHAALTRARIDLSYATVVAPISGRIGRALVTEGALVGKGEATHLATIEQHNPIWADFAQSSADFQRLRRSGGGNQGPVKLILDEGREYGHAGKLLFNDLAVDPATGSVGMRAEFPNPNRDLLPGQFVTVRLPVARADNAIAVPQRAVQVSPQGQMVMLVGADGTVMPRPVKTGGLAGGDWIIAEGLKGGEQVIVNGIQKARPGTMVKAVPLGGEAPATAPAAQPVQPAGTAKQATPAARK
jgi:membrane fusion protein (multidrug efflux system)